MKMTSSLAAYYFEYTGLTALTVTGVYTGKRYRFKQTGDVELIDARDVQGMMNVPVLKRINKQ